MGMGIQLIVGLGNPGAEYEATRHNAGFWWVESIARANNVQLSQESKFFGRVARLKSPEVWLLTPSTFMNASGQSVGTLARFYRIAPESILVVHDELDLETGVAKLKKGGGHGGHNGLKDIAAHLGSNDFWRLRLGISHPGDAKDVINYVLHKPSREEFVLIDSAIENTAGLLPLLLAGDFETAMLKLHTKVK
ncbi:MAG: aminoacyl-tRNA hydrolase [Methylophilales bacterium]|nr:aminoacyl-tRNA hydrolase [Methylophilales bacterium]